MIDLKEIFNQHPNCLNNKASFKSILMDEYPSEKRMINILAILFECGIVNKIKSKSTISSTEMHGLLTQVENDYGISAQYSQSAILIWAAAFGITASTVKVQDTATLSSETKGSVDNVPPEYVEGNVADYALKMKSDGCYIKRFNGFEEDEITIPSLIDGKQIKGIAQEAFKGCVQVKKIHISEGIEIIENGAFKECTALREVSLPDSLKRLGNNPTQYGMGVFSKTRLSSIIIPQNVEFIGPSCFEFCTSLRKITIPRNVKFLGAYCFNYCTNLEEVTLSDEIEVIHEKTFSYCSSLSEIKLPNKLSKIEEAAFICCSQLQEIHIPFGTRSIGKDAFERTYLSAIYIPPTITEISSSGNTLGNNPQKLTIYCAAGSTAMEYARKRNIKCAKAQF